LRDLLELAGSHEVLVVVDRAEGIASARSLGPDVIICELGLPTVDGFEVPRRIRSDSAAAHQLVVLIGYAGADDVELSTGFDCHLAKPADLEVLLRIIRNAPGRTHAEPTLARGTSQ